ncbi:hypothetical protein TNCV_932651 [Trichonephila clavipes]|nr:hypothetical protein TNCV_932651 [Trichonephila clavipes]
MRAFGDGLRNFEPWSSDKDVTCVCELAPPLLTTTPTGGRLSSQQILRSSLLYMTGLKWYLARTHETPATI